MFSSFLVVARRLDFWSAMATSRRAVTANLGSVIVLLLALLGIDILGVIACLVGLILSIPTSYCAAVVVFQMLFEEEPAIPPIPGPVVI